MAVVQQAPFVMKNSNGEFEGYCIDLIDELKKLMNFEYELYEVEEYGKMDPDMNWNGMIKELVDKVTMQSLSWTVIGP